jgi:hypothetical protein
MEDAERDDDDEFRRRRWMWSSNGGLTTFRTRREAVVRDNDAGRGDAWWALACKHSCASEV